MASSFSEPSVLAKPLQLIRSAARGFGNLFDQLVQFAAFTFDDEQLTDIFFLVEKLVKQAVGVIPDSFTLGAGRRMWRAGFWGH